MRSGLVIFPDRSIGAGLLTLRASVTASFLLLASAASNSADWGQIYAVALGAALCIGYRTRIAACLSAAGAICAFTAEPTLLTMSALHLTNATVLALAGPGAYSADAHRFGRRSISLRQGDDTIV